MISPWGGNIHDYVLLYEFDDPMSYSPDDPDKTKNFHYKFFIPKNSLTTLHGYYEVVDNENFKRVICSEWRIECGLWEYRHGPGDTWSRDNCSIRFAKILFDVSNNIDEVITGHD